MDSCLCMGASVGMVSGLSRTLPAEDAKRVVGVIGDSTFIHSGITGLVDAVYNGGAGTLLVLDNRTTAMTGHQEHPATGKRLSGEAAPRLDIPAVARAIGVKRVRTADAYHVLDLAKAIREEMEADDVLGDRRAERVRARRAPRLRPADGGGRQDLHALRSVPLGGLPGHRVRGAHAAHQRGTLQRLHALPAGVLELPRGERCRRNSRARAGRTLRRGLCAAAQDQPVPGHHRAGVPPPVRAGREHAGAEAAQGRRRTLRRARQAVPRRQGPASLGARGGAVPWRPRLEARPRPRNGAGAPRGQGRDRGKRSRRADRRLLSGREGLSGHALRTAPRDRGHAHRRHPRVPSSSRGAAAIARSPARVERRLPSRRDGGSRRSVRRGSTATSTRSSSPPGSRRPAPWESPARI